MSLCSVKSVLTLLAEDQNVCRNIFMPLIENKESWLS